MKKALDCININIIRFSGIKTYVRILKKPKEKVRLLIIIITNKTVYNNPI